MADTVIHLPLTTRERNALDELAIADGLSPERVMVQALRLYQLVRLGHAKVTMPNHLVSDYPLTEDAIRADPTPPEEQ